LVPEGDTWESARDYERVVLKPAYGATREEALETAKILVKDYNNYREEKYRMAKCVIWDREKNTFETILS
jgi:hypothetical protein